MKSQRTIYATRNMHVFYWVTRIILIATPPALQDTGPDEERVVVEPLHGPPPPTATAPKSSTVTGPRASSTLGASSKPGCPHRS